MLSIVAHHYVVNSGLIDIMYNAPLSIKSLFLFIFGMWGKVGINCFVLITGYFMCTSNITIRKFLKLLLEIYFYNIIIYCVFILTGYDSISLKGLFHSLWPIGSIASGFVSCFLMFYLTIPFLNILIKNLDEKKHLYLIGLSLFIYTILSIIPVIKISFNYVTWFIIIYFIASYIRLYPKKIFQNTRFWAAMTFISIIISVLSVITLLVITSKYHLPYRLQYFFVADSNKILAVIVSVCSFLWFKNINLKYNKVINLIGASTFGVLLIHANSDTMRQWLWKDMLNNVNVYSSPMATVILHAVISVLIIFIVCSVIDILRNFIIEKPLFARIDKKFTKINSAII